MYTSLTPGTSRIGAPVARRRINGRKIGAADLHIDRRGHSEVQHCVDESAGLEVCRQFRHLLRASAGAHGSCTRSCRRDVPFNAPAGTGVRRGIAGVNGREVRRDADVGTIISRSSASPFRRTSLFDTRNLALGDLEIGAGAAFRLITNWPASVMGRTTCRAADRERACAKESEKHQRVRIGLRSAPRSSTS